MDEFQGMEFDVIFLSVVRSGANFEDSDLEKLQTAHNELCNILDKIQKDYHATNVPDELQKEKLAKERVIKAITSKYYGFLNDNRLCVALSRQKKLLIVVGDAAMFSGRAATPFAKRCVLAMHKLYALCEGEGSVVDG